MKPFLNSFSGALLASSASANCPRCFRPQLEQLDDRLVPSAVSGVTDPAAMPISLVSSPNPSVLGQRVAFTVISVISASGPFSLNPPIPTGTVAFADGATILGTSTLVANVPPSAHVGQIIVTANFSTKALSVGSHTITATYPGDSNYAMASSSLIQTVNLPTTSENQNYVTQLYLDLLRRAPDGSGLTFWTGLLDQNKANRFQLALAFVNSPEFRTQEVEDVYHTLLHRDADQTGLRSWTQFLAGGNTLEQLQAQIVASDLGQVPVSRTQRAAESAYRSGLAG